MTDPTPASVDRDLLRRLRSQAAERRRVVEQWRTVRELAIALTAFAAGASFSIRALVLLVPVGIGLSQLASHRMWKATQ